MKLSIILPVYNEKDTILKVLDALKKANVCGLEKEIIIIDDCSVDGTRQILENLKEKNVKVLYHTKNQGKSAALKTGFSSVTGDIITIQDADLEYDPNELEKLLMPIINNEADIVYGSRFMQNKRPDNAYKIHTLANKFLTFLSNIFSGLKLTDMETCYKVFRHEVVKDIEIEEKRFGFEPEVTAKIASKIRKYKYKIIEIPISYNPRSYLQGKKIGFKDGIEAIWCIIKYNDSFIATFFRYAISGIIAALTQFFLMVIFVEIFLMRTILLQNIANVLSILFSMVLVFLLHSFFSWRYKFDSILIFFKKLFDFFVFSGVLLIFRIILFYLLSLIGTDYRVNTIINIGVVIILNFAFYNLFLFKKKTNQ